MPTTVVKTIGTGGDYSTMQAWEDACPANLITADQIWQGQLKNETFTISSGAGVVISGTTSSQSQYVELTTAPGAGFRDNANKLTNALRYNASNGAAIAHNSTYASAIDSSVDFTRISNLQISVAATSSKAFSSNSTGNLVDACIFEYGTNRGVTLGVAGRLRNSLCVLRASPTDAVEVSGDCELYNCTIAATSGNTPTNGLRGNYGSTTPIKNCVILGCTNVKTGGSTYTFTTCMTDVASPPSGCTTVTYNTALIVSKTDGSQDYRVPAGSALINAGTTDATNAPTDIVGTARPNGAYDVGAWEFSSAATAGKGIASR